MLDLESLSEIEQLKFLKSARVAFSSDASFLEYLKKFDLKIETSEVIRRIHGLMLEDEFIVLCTIMRCCSLINKMEQSTLKNSDFKVPDFLILLSQNDNIYTETKIDKTKFFVEVKTTASMQTKAISKGFLNKYTKFSKAFEIPLLFASRLDGGNKQRFWILQTIQQFEETKRMASIEAMSQSIGHFILNDYFIITISDLIIRRTFKKEKNHSLPFSPKWGYLSRTELISDKETIVVHEHIHNLFLDCIPAKKVTEETVGDNLIVITQIPFLTSILLSDMLLRANECIISNKGENTASATRLLALHENNNFQFIYREQFEYALNFFESFMIAKINDDQTNESLVKILNMV